ncbi:hypothetical protein CBR_g39592 [Chara braunii]|uniref:Uncharacterized protein n=1 Tax=Chara braunii TaxID=69332 RepID=A0A388K193_CHABU|nr:hypothetical protein CBR_g39592 [Chara braunii]|eukprot:GBG63808.1 hypothetical protein CBR_g39592 [Chara braunii]
MFVYLSKKIAIPNGVKLRSVAWNSEQGWIACGGDSGLLKVLKLESGPARDAKASGRKGGATAAGGAGAANNLSMNQTLEGHNGAVVVVQWNENYRKLTTSDQYGLIIVWMLHKGMWFEEMINNRNKSVVKDMKWTSDGQKICIVYEDGAVIVGSVDGNRLWGKELPLQLALVEWSPDGRLILFCTLEGECYIFDQNGNQMARLPLLSDSVVEQGRTHNNNTTANNNNSNDNNNNNNENTDEEKNTNYNQNSSSKTAIIGVDWYDGLEGYSDPNSPTLAIGMANGKLQLMRHETDEEPIIVETYMKSTHLKWNSNGTVLAVGGVQTASNGTVLAVGGVVHQTATTATAGTAAAAAAAAPGPGAGPGGGSVGLGSDLKEITVVQFLSNTGTHLRTLRVPGSGISGLSWEGCSLRIALAVDSYIYFANVRPDYKWGWLGTVCAYSFMKLDRAEHCIMFWDTERNETFCKYVKRLIDIKAAGDHCVVSTRGEEPGQYILILCNAIGSPIDSKYLDIEPIHLAISETHVFAASEDIVYTWQYNTAAPTPRPRQRPWTSGLGSTTDNMANSGRNGSTMSDKIMKGYQEEKTFHIDDSSLPSDKQQPAANQRGPGGGGGGGGSEKPSLKSKDPITCICASDKLVMVGRASGVVHRYTLPLLVLENKDKLNCSPQFLSLNCNSSRMAVVDSNGVLTLYDLNYHPEVGGVGVGGGGGGGVTTGSSVGRHLREFERKDVWDLRWASDDEELLAVMEKTRMYIFRGLDPEEPISSSAYICSFDDLRIRAVHLDEVMKQPDQPEKDLVVDFETKSLRDTRQILATVSLQDAYTYVDEHSHPRLWRILAEHALEKLDLVIADKAFVRCQDYHGILFVKGLQILADSAKQKAEVCTYFRRFDEAESIYMDMDRPDLAIELRMRLGDWFRVEKLAQNGAGDDALLALAWTSIGEYYADRQKWPKAAHYFSQAKNTAKLAECLYMLENWQALEKLVPSIPDGSLLLNSLGEKFVSVGMCENAVAAYQKVGEVGVKKAIDCCILLNQWDRAVQLAEAHNFSQIETLLTKYASHLLEKKKPMQAIELYRKAGRHADAARLANRLAQDFASTSNSNPLRVKKLYVLAALEVEKFRKKTIDIQMTTGGRGVTSQQQPHMTMAAATLEGLVQHEEAASLDKSLTNAWHGAEGYHLWLLSQRQMHNNQIAAAMTTTLRLCDYEDVLDAFDIYSLVAITSYFNKCFAQCSKAFIRLERMSETSRREKHKAYSDLAMSIFIDHPPVDPVGGPKIVCPQCKQPTQDWRSRCPSPTCNNPLPFCVASGRSIGEEPRIKCHVCRHLIITSELGPHTRSCPLCHSALDIHRGSHMHHRGSTVMAPNPFFKSIH